MPKRLTQEEFLKRAYEIHGDYYDYSKVDYINSNTKVCIICPIHGEFYQKPIYHLSNKAGCPDCGYNKLSKLYAMTLDEFIFRSKKVHNNKFDYSKVIYKNMNTKVNIICPIHGEFEVTPINHLNGVDCPKCASVAQGLKHRHDKMNINTFVQKARKKHGDKYDYSKVYLDPLVKSHDLRVVISCPIHGDFTMGPRVHLQGSGCPMCNASKGELKIRDFLQKHNIEFESQKSFKDFYGTKGFKYRYDFYIKSHNLLIEYNGVQHYKYVDFFYKSQADFIYRRHIDNLKKIYAIKHNIDLLTIPYWDISRIDVILSEIFSLESPIRLKDL